MIGMNIFFLLFTLLIAFSGEYPPVLTGIVIVLYLVMLTGTIMFLRKPTKAAFVIYVIGAIGFAPLSVIGITGAKSIREKYQTSASKTNEE